MARRGARAQDPTPPLLFCLYIHTYINTRSQTHIHKARTYTYTHTSAEIMLTVSLHNFPLGLFVPMPRGVYTHTVRRASKRERERGTAYNAKGQFIQIRPSSKTITDIHVVSVSPSLSVSLAFSPQTHPAALKIARERRSRRLSRRKDTHTRLHPPPHIQGSIRGGSKWKRKQR